MKRRNCFRIILGLAAFVVSSSLGHASDFNILPSTGSFGVKREVVATVKIDTAGEIINAAQARVSFNPAILEVTSLSKVGSIFNFWLQEPVFSNTDGIIEFIGGTVNGISGSSLQVLQVHFITKGVGSSDISFTDASIAAADGSGTNILSNANGAQFTVSSSAIIPPAHVPAPAQIARTPTEAAGLPAKPVVVVPLYPDPDGWYSVTAQFLASWELPSDISGISTALNADPAFTVPPVSEGLFEAKIFPAIGKDGVQYLHVRFKNNKGWGPVRHHRIAVDSQPPIPFKIDIKTGAASDNPSPKLSFNTTDALSGVQHYEISMNSEEPIIVNGPDYLFTPHPPGAYAIKVRAYDKAGNSVEDRVAVEILPIESPSITAINKKVIIGTDDLLTVKGLALLGSDVIVAVEDKNKFLVLQGEAGTNSQGEWEFRFDKELRRGDYFVSVNARDARGALSLPTDPIKVSFVEKSIVSLFGWDITLRGLVVLLTALIILAGLYYRKATLLRSTRSQRETIIISRDLSNAFNAVKKDLDSIAGVIAKDALTDEKKLVLDSTTRKIVDSLDALEKYVRKDIERLR